MGRRAVQPDVGMGFEGSADDSAAAEDESPEEPRIRSVTETTRSEPGTSPGWGCPKIRPGTRSSMESGVAGAREVIRGALVGTRVFGVACAAAVLERVCVVLERAWSSSISEETDCSIGFRVVGSGTTDSSGICSFTIDGDGGEPLSRMEPALPCDDPHPSWE